MKRLKLRMPALLLATALIFSACQQQEERGLLKFGLEFNEAGLEKAARESETQLSGALITITDASGLPVLEKEYIELIRFGSSYITQSLELAVGEYLLDEFMLVDAAGEVIWATPRVGSALAHLVREPLPRPFSVHPEETTSLDLQVVKVSDHPPGDFGYAEFHVEFVNRMCMQVYFSCRCPDMWNDTTPRVNDAGVPWYAPIIQFTVGDRVVEETLFPGLNQYNLPLYPGYYSIVVYDYYGQEIFRQKYSQDEIHHFSCAHGTPLVIHHGSWPEITYTPEDLSEPGIQQGVFGQMFLPIDANGNPDGSDSLSDIAPVILDLYVYPAFTIDSLLAMVDFECAIPENMIWEQPLAIVRANSMGFFELPLEVGQYSYLVKTDWGFTLDANISSRRPGIFMVYPSEVTVLHIPVLDCALMNY